MVEVNVWEDREVKFDIHNVQNRLRSGEFVLSVLDYIEDTKGNPHDAGRLFVTNLRIIWYSLTTAKFNLSIGLSCILSMSTKTVLSKLRGTTQALYILTVHHSSRFEFVFTNMSLDNTRQFPAIFDVYKLYQGSVLYRDLKLRSSVVSARQLRVLPQEQVYSTVPGIWNLSSDQGNLGTFIVTNVRLVWYADVNEMFNISLPYMQMAAIRVRDSKYGPALVIHTQYTAGGYVLGFRVDPVDRLRNVFKELSSLYTIHGVTPMFGVFYEAPDASAAAVLPVEPQLRVEDIEEVDHGAAANEISTKIANYLADEQPEEMVGQQRPKPVYCEELGFAIEPIREGYSLADLWEVVPTAVAASAPKRV